MWIITRSVLTVTLVRLDSLGRSKLCQEDRTPHASIPVVDSWFPMGRSIVRNTPHSIHTMRNPQKRKVTTEGGREPERCSWQHIRCVFVARARERLCQPQLLTISFPIEVTRSCSGIRKTGSLCVSPVTIPKQ